MILYIILGLLFCASVAFSVFAYIEATRVKNALLKIIGPELENQKNEIIKIKKKL